MTKPTTLWIGLRDFVGNNTVADYKWIVDNSSDTRYVKWKTNHQQGYDCVSVVLENSPIFQNSPIIFVSLQDYNCSDFSDGICETNPV